MDEGGEGEGVEWGMEGNVWDAIGHGIGGGEGGEEMGTYSSSSAIVIEPRGAPDPAIGTIGLVDDDRSSRNGTRMQRLHLRKPASRQDPAQQYVSVVHFWFYSSHVILITCNQVSKSSTHPDCFLH